MNFKVLLVILTLGFVLTSCSPRIHYMGDRYEPINNKIDVFYSKDDVEQPYKTIGRLTHDSGMTNTDKIKNIMIEEARKKGADGIIFDRFGVQQGFSGGVNGNSYDNLAISATAILYKD